MMTKAYLITGGLGFLGSALTKALVRAGYRVRVLDNCSRGNPKRLAGVLGDIELITGDVRDADVVHRALRGVHSVCHLASVNGTANFYKRPAEVLEVGVKGLMNVLEGCLRAGVGELVLASSSEVYQTPPAIPTTESVPLSIPDPYNPRYSYAGAKVISELMAIHWGKARLQRVLIFRPHNVYGPDMGGDHVIPQLTLKLLRMQNASAGEEISLPIQGSGEETRAFLHIDDCIAGLLLLLERGEHLNVYNIGTMEERPIREVAQRIAECLGMRIRLVPGPIPEGSTQRRCPDTRKLQALGFQPRISFEEGLKTTVAWYATHISELSHASAVVPE